MNPTKQKLDEIVHKYCRQGQWEKPCKTAILKLMEEIVPEDKKAYLVKGKSDSWASGYNTCCLDILDRLKEMR